MTRDKGKDGLWSMICDLKGCGTRSEGFPEQPPLDLFQERGWFIAAKSGDICPACLAKGVRPTAEPYRGIVPVVMSGEKQETRA